MGALKHLSMFSVIFSVVSDSDHSETGTTLPGTTLRDSTPRITRITSFWQAVVPITDDTVRALIYQPRDSYVTADPMPTRQLQRMRMPARGCVKRAFPGWCCQRRRNGQTDLASGCPIVRFLSADSIPQVVGKPQRIACSLPQSSVDSTATGHLRG